MSQEQATARIADHFEKFAASLVVGKVVEVRWTNSHRYYSARAEVAKVNAQTIACRLLERVAIEGADYPRGHVIRVPKQYAPRWSPNNGVFPLPPLQGILIDDEGVCVVRPERSDAAVLALLGCTQLQPHEFYVSTHPGLLVGSQFVALQDAHWPALGMPIYEPAIPLRGPLFIVRVPLVIGGYWQSLSSTDIAAFQRLFGVPVREVSP